MIFGAALVDWWLRLTVSLVTRALILCGKRKIRGLRLFRRLPRWAFPPLPGVKSLEEFDKSIPTIESSEYPPFHPGVRLAYASVIGWWLSALSVLFAWAPMMTLVAIPAAQQLHTLVPRFATLARYDVPW